MLLDLILMLCTGVITGVLSGLFGLGGGVVVVPIMVLYFKLHGVSPAIDMHMAVGTSLAIMIITTFNSIFAHYRAKNIIWPVVWRIMPFMLVGAIAGTLVAHFIHAQFLRYFFIAFLLYVIVMAIFKKSFTADYQLSDFQEPKRGAAAGLGTLFGFIAVLLGIGGSVLMVPYLRHLRCPMKRASAIAVSLTPAVAIIGAIGYMIIGMEQITHFRYSIGYVYVPAFFGIGLGTFAGVPLGVYLSKRIKDAILAKVYILLLVIFLIMIAV